MLGNYIKNSTVQGFVTLVKGSYYWVNNHEKRYEETPEILWEFPQHLAHQTDIYLPILGKPKQEQISILLPQWEQHLNLSDIPKPTATEKYEGWTIGVVLANCDSKAKNTKELKQIQITGNDGTWIKNIDPPAIVAKKDWFVVGCAAIDLINATLYHLPDLSELVSEGNPQDTKVNQTQIIPFDQIERDAGTQQRQQLQPYTIERYCDRFKMGDVPPPAEIRQCPETGKNYLVDGFHRFAAQQRAIGDIEAGIRILDQITPTTGEATITALTKELDGYGLAELSLRDLELLREGLAAGLLCRVTIGDRLAAIWDSCAVNADHGQNRTRADLYRAIDTALLHPKGASLNNREIAAHVRCDVKTVRVRRAMLEQSNQIKPAESVTVKRGGTTYKMSLGDLKRDKGIQTSGHTFEDVTALYAPWGKFERHWDKDYKFRFEHPDRTIHFKTLDEAHEKFAKVTDGLTKAADLAKPIIYPETNKTAFEIGDRVKGFDQSDGRKELTGFIADVSSTILILNSGKRIFRDSAVLIEKYAATDKRGQIKEQIAASIEPQQFAQNDYKLVILDPPWLYHLRETDESHRNRTPYPNMTDQEILDLPIANISATDAYCLLWTTTNHLPLAFKCLETWGFDYKSIHTWVKMTLDGSAVKFGVGHYGRNATEFFLVGTKGKPPSFTALGLTDIPTVIHEAPQHHSAKPDKFYQFAHRLSNALSGSTIELFARSPQTGWDLWGAEAPQETENEMSQDTKNAS